MHWAIYLLIAVVIISLTVFFVLHYKKENYDNFIKYKTTSNISSNINTIDNRRSAIDLIVKKINLQNSNIRNADEFKMLLQNSLDKAMIEFKKLPNTRKFEIVFNLKPNSFENIENVEGINYIGPKGRDFFQKLNDNINNSIKDKLNRKIEKPNQLIRLNSIENNEGELDDKGNKNLSFIKSLKILQLFKKPVVPSGTKAVPEFPIKFKLNNVNSNEQKPPIIIVPGILASNLHSKWVLSTQEKEKQYNKLLRTDLDCDLCVDKCVENCPIPMWSSDKGFYWGGCFQNCIPAPIAHPINCACQALQNTINYTGDNFNKIIFPDKSDDWYQIWANIWWFKNVDYLKNLPSYLLSIDVNPNNISFKDLNGVNSTAWKDVSYFPGCESVKGVTSLKEYNGILSAIVNILNSIDYIIAGSAILAPAVAIMLLVYREQLLEVKNIVQKLLNDGYLQKSFDDFIKFLTLQGYQENKNIFGAPYDWRKIADPEYYDLYYSMLKELVEQAYQVNGNKKVILVAHSMGCVSSHRFLTQWLIERYGSDYAGKWKDYYINCFVPINGPLGGVAVTTRSVISGNDVRGEGKITNENKEFARQISGLWLLQPNPKIWPEKFLKVNNKEYSGNNLSQAFSDFKDTSKFSPIYSSIKNYSDNYQLSPPGVKVHSFTSTDNGSEMNLVYKNFTDQPTITTETEKMNIELAKNPPNQEVNVIMNYPDMINFKLGDGSVPYKSQMVPVLWKNNNKNSNGDKLAVTCNRIKNSEHMEILQNTEFFKNFWNFIGSYK
jgi:hypothetical protein